MIDLQKLARPEILALQPYRSARDEYDDRATVFLDANETPYGQLNRYPDPWQRQLKTLLADRQGVRPANIFIGNGSDEVIDLALRIFCRPGQDKALTFYPGYSMYGVSAAFNGVEFLQLALTPDFQLDTVRLSPYLADNQLKLIFLCSPNNPTGNLLNPTDVEFVLNRFSGLVVLDEAYIEFSEAESWVARLAQYPNLIVSQTLSKAWGLAAARVGVAYAHEEIMALFNKVKPPYNVSTLNQQAAIAALQRPDVLARNRQAVLEEKERVAAALQQLALVKKVYPSEANFLLVEVQEADRLYKQLLARGIVVRNRNSLVPDCLRLTIGTPAENTRLINALNELSE